MKFSIITACYNSGAKIKRAVGSIRGQAGVSLEHIIQDGQSGDNSLDWLFSQSDLDVRSEADSGMYQAINRGWARASGDILSWLNSDEQYLPGTLEKVLSVFEKYPDVDVVWGNMICIDPSGEPIAARREIPARFLYMRNCTCYMPSCAVFFRRKLWDSGILKLDETFRVSADKDLYLRLLRANIKMFHIKDYLSLFEVSDENLSVTMKHHVKDEGIRIYRDYGAFKNPILRRAVHGLRYCEKLMQGSYFRRDISYTLTISDKPEYREVSAPHVGSRFAF